MIHIDHHQGQRSLKKISYSADFTIVGGGLAGTCAAIQAAREGLSVILIQDRPMLGGNASSEVRLWALGATSHMGNNNRWAREGGIIDEIVVENTFRNREGNPIIFDTVVLEKVMEEKNITLLLNTAVYEAKTNDSGNITSVTALCSQNSTQYEVSSPLFCDASGDGVLGFLAGAAFRIGAEAKEEFDEGLAPDQGFGHLLGHSIYFYSKDVGQPVSFTPPSYALEDLGDIPKYRKFNAKTSGTALWWIEHGGRLDTVHATEEIKWELWKVVYGVWNHIKNSGQFPEAETMTLEWVGMIPGKRESRRFEGDYMIHQKDIVSQTHHEDIVSYGGWAIDLHPADGVYSELDGCTQYHSKGVYGIPYRCMYSRNIPNLFLAGRIISASHVAFGSTRVMMSCSHNAQAVGTAAAIATESNSKPNEIDVTELQVRLSRAGQFIPHLNVTDLDDLSQYARMTASSTRKIERIKRSGEVSPLTEPYALLFPASAGKLPQITACFATSEACEIEVQLRVSSTIGNYTPDVTLATQILSIPAGDCQSVPCDFDLDLGLDQYVFFCIMPASGVSVHLSDEILTGITTVGQRQHKAVAKSAVQMGPEGSGIDTFEFWLPKRRHEGKNIAVKFDPPLSPYSVDSLASSYERPFIRSNAWVSDPEDENPAVTLTWDKPQSLSRLTLCFDTDLDHPMETAQWSHPENMMPLCARHFLIVDHEGNTLFEKKDNHQSRVEVTLSSETISSSIKIVFPGIAPISVSLFKIWAF